ncbi:hypothetical protein GCM10008983_09890 [Lentibacillus halophilus]|uniref:Uncharacterized protein n=1 Tax=Lentibacillus halophilus TaxID=295065 RepID=A0ABP3J1L9_9BACI
MRFGLCYFNGDMDVAAYTDALTDCVIHHYIIDRRKAKVDGIGDVYNIYSLSYRNACDRHYHVSND